MATMAARYSDEDSQLIVALHKLVKAAPKLVKSSTYPAPADTTIAVRSWKMNEHKYYVTPSPFPTLARGLFTVELPKEDDGVTETKDTTKYKIVVRGYDKFFNIGEVPWTTVRNQSTPAFLFIILTVAVVKPVALTRSADGRSLCLVTQIEWLHHFHCRTHTIQAPHHVKAFYRPRVKYAYESCPGW